MTIGDVILNNSHDKNISDKILNKLISKIFNFLKLCPDFPDKSL